MSAREKRIAALERKTVALAEKREKTGERQGTFEELFELAFQFLSSHSKLWNFGSLHYRQLVLRLTFFFGPSLLLPSGVFGPRKFPCHSK